MMDIEAAIIKFLAEKTLLPVSADVPNPRPDEFITVELVGGGGRPYIDHPQVVVQSWAKSRFVASQNARKIQAFMYCLPYEVDDVMGCSCNTLTDLPDPDSKTPRYQGLYDLSTC